MPSVSDGDREVLEALAFLEGTSADELVAGAVRGLVESARADRLVSQVVEARRSRSLAA